MQEKDSQIQSLMETVNRLQKSVNSTSTPVGFCTTLSSHTTLGQLQIIDFDKTVTDTSHSYNNSTGVFTIPRTGLYQFSLTMFTPSGNLYAQIVKNQQIIGSNYGSGSGISATINTVVWCIQGDVVFVRHMKGQSQQIIHGNGYSTFSGFLIGQ
ncbi:C1QL [Mytilus edulis]|uniref:C1QL n=1 Tax=Mytilus edulis TaxID=6550 RepID=A0A8S3Q2U4_MYTED|nr:C1QL [Mytilus edulis]